MMRDAASSFLSRFFDLALQVIDVIITVGYDLENLIEGLAVQKAVKGRSWMCGWRNLIMMSG